MNCQKVINVLAVSSFVVSGAVVGTGANVFANRASIIDGVQKTILKSVTGSLGGGLPGMGGDALPTGSNDLPQGTPTADTGLGVAPF